MIHLGATRGRKNHPEDGPERHDLNGFPIARVDENENVIEIVKEGEGKLPTNNSSSDDTEREVSKEAVREHIRDLRDRGLDEEAKLARQRILKD